MKETRRASTNLSPVTRRQRRQTSRGLILGIVMGSFILHAGVVAAVGELGVAGVGADLRAAAARAANQATLEAQLKKTTPPSCMADVYLAAAARAALCATPLGGDTAACVKQVEHEMELWALSCERMVLATTDLPTALAVLTPKEIDEIEAEALLETLTPQDQKKFEEKKQEELVAMAEQAKQREAAPSPRAQVVEVAKPEVEMDPDNARFVSDHASKVEKQTVARGSRFEDMVAKPSPAELSPTKNPVETPSAAQPKEPLPPGANPEAPRNPGPLAMRAPGAREIAADPLFAKTRGQIDGSTDPVLAGGVIPRRGDGALRTSSRELPAEAGQGGAGGGAPPIPDLTPSRQNLERAVGGGSVDHLEDVDGGEFTALNSKRWKHASFFNRLKRQVAQNWEPAAVYLRRDPTGSIYGVKSRTTSVRVSLSTDGVMQDIIIVDPSGIDFLDDEAVRAFRAAGPFPNPPREMADRENKITFEFAFHFEIGSRSNWKIYRSR